MLADLIGTSEVIKEYGIPRHKIRMYLEPITRNGRPYRINGEYVYSKDDVLEARKQLDREMRREKRRTLYREDLKPAAAAKLANTALMISYLSELGYDISDISAEHKHGIQNLMRSKELYISRTGPVKRISYGFVVKKKVDEDRAKAVFPEEDLKKHKILKQEIDVKTFERKGPLIARQLLGAFIKDYTDARKTRHATAGAFLRSYKTGIPRKYLLQVIEYIESGTLSDTKIGRISRNVAGELIEERRVARRVKSALSKKAKAEVKRIASEQAEKLASPPKGLDALLKSLPCD